MNYTPSLLHIKPVLKKKIWKGKHIPYSPRIAQLLFEDTALYSLNTSLILRGSHSCCLKTLRCILYFDFIQ